LEQPQLVAKTAAKRLATVATGGRSLFFIEWLLPGRGHDIFGFEPFDCNSPKDEDPSDRCVRSPVWASKNPVVDSLESIDPSFVSMITS
jgi:hypothetical protein